MEDSAKRSSNDREEATEVHEEEPIAIPVISDDMSTIDVEFVVHTLQKEDEAGVEKLFQQLFWKDQFTTREWTNLVMSQWELVGSAIKVEGSTDVFGFISVVNLHKYAEESFVKRFKDYLLKNCSNDKHKENLEAILNDKERGLGLLFNERVMNTPNQLAPHLHTILHEEIEGCVEDGESFDFDNYLYLCKTYREVIPDDLADAKRRKTEHQEENKNENGNPSSDEDSEVEDINNEIQYYNEEDEIIMEEATLKFDFSIKHAIETKDKAVVGDKYVEMRRELGIIPKSKFPKILKKINEEFS